MAMLNKSGTCARFGWTRYEFDLRVAAGMPVVQMAAHKGAEWVVDPAAVEAWLAELQRAAAERRRLRAEARGRQQQEEAERKRRAEQRFMEQEEERRNNNARTMIYCAVRMAAHQAHFAGKTDIYNSPEWEPFLATWPYPQYPLGGPDWWLPPPGSVAAMRPRLDPWIDGKVKDMPSADDLVPDIDLTQPWPWRCV